MKTTTPIIFENGSLIDEVTIRRLIAMFSNNDDFLRHLRNLKQTRAGIYTIQERMPHLADAVFPQFDTLNELIGVLLNTWEASRAFHEL